MNESLMNARYLTWLALVLTIGLSIVAAGNERGVTANTKVARTTALNPQNYFAQSNSRATTSRQILFLDDRTSPVQLLKSYYNAINRQEYVRAYSYWGSRADSGGSQPPAYPQFKAGYTNTKAVQLTTGRVTSEGAAGSIYFQVPVMLNVTNTNGAKHNYVGCYTIRQVNPQNFSVPPYAPMHIDSAKIREVTNRSNNTSLMNQICQ